MPAAAVPDLSRRERRKLEVRARIVEASMGLFDERGFAATKVSEICERADIAHKTFFNYFPSKRDVLREIAAESLDRLLELVESVRAVAASTRERLRVLFEQIAIDAESAGPMRRELLTEMVHVAHEAQTESEQARRVHAAFGKLVRDGRAAGELPLSHSAQTQTEMIVGAFYALMFNWAHLERYALRRRALAAARLLADALGTLAEKEKRRSST